MVEQVRDHDEERHAANVLGVVGDGGGQVGLAAAVAASEQQPAFRLLGKFAGGVESFLQAAAVGGGQALTFTQVKAGEVALAQQVERGELVGAVVGGAAEIGGKDADLGDQLRVAEARADAALDLV